jgi:iron complex outermembrane recepter protein
MKLLYTLPLLLATLQTFSQNNPAITGILKDQNGESAPYVAVVLLNKDSAIVKTDISKDNGSFSFLQVKDGEYRIATSSLQFKTFLSSVFEFKGQQIQSLGELVLTPMVTQLKEVEVTAAKQMVEIHPDKTVFNIQGTINSAGNDGMDLLSKAPGIMVDNNDNLIVMGKNGVLIYVDGKRSQLRGDDLTAMLRSLRSENIESIEIITNPSSKYDAEGNAGIINIRLKRDANLGLNGNVVVGFSTDVQERYNAGLTLNNRTRKMNAYGSYSYYDNAGESHFDLDKQLNGFLLQNRSRDIWNNKGNDVRLGADFFVHKSHTVGVLVNSSFIDRSNETNARTPISGENTPPELLVARNVQGFDIMNNNINLNYQYSGKKGSTLNVDADYGHYSNNGGNYQPNFYFDESGENELSRNANKNERETTIDIKTLKADYETNLGKGRLGLGFKLSSVESANILFFYNQDVDNENAFVYDSSRSNSFNYVEEITAFYANYNRKFGDKVSLNAGLRSETTHSVGELLAKTQSEDDLVERQYTNLFPSAGLTYEMDKKNKIGISYSKRIDRPNYQNLNPFEFKLDELTFMKGNPFLKPQYTSNYQFTYSWNSKLNAILSYSLTNDFFAQVLDTTGTRGSRMITKNLADGTNVAANVSYPFDITKWWNVRGNVNVYYAQYKAYLEGVNFNLDVAAYNLSLQSTLTFPHDLKVEVSGWYNSPSIWRGTIRTSYMWSTTAGIRKTIFKNGQLSASVNDIFNTQRWYIHSNYGGMKVDGSGRFSFRRFIVGFNYRFGNQKVKAARSRKSGLEEERNRLDN